MAEFYISSTKRDLKECREEAYEVLRKLGQVVAMEDYDASSQPPLKICLEDVARCDIYIGIFARRYGSIPPNQSKSFTHLEYEQAKANNKTCLIFLLKESAPWEIFPEDEENKEKLEELQKELKNKHSVGEFSTKDELARKIQSAVIKELERIENKLDKNPSRVEESEYNRERLKVLTPIIIVFLLILVLTVLTMIMFITVPSIKKDFDPNLALYSLGAISAFIICCLMFIIHKLLPRGF